MALTKADKVVINAMIDAVVDPVKIRVGKLEERVNLLEDDLQATKALLKGHTHAIQPEGGLVATTRPAQSSLTGTSTGGSLVAGSFLLLPVGARITMTGLVSGGAPAEPITYTDVTFTGGDPTGVSDSATAINSFIQAQADGADSTHHKRIIFPHTANYRTGTGLCVGGKNHMTLWGHGPGTSAWQRGSSLIRRDVGCRITPILSSVATPAHAAFVAGSKQTGNGTINYEQGGSDVHIRGFDIYGPSSNPGIFPSANGNEVQGVFEAGRQADVQFYYNRARAMPGDLVRFRSTIRGYVHHNYSLSQGRMAASFIVNPNYSSSPHADARFEDNTVDRAGYWFFDVETEDHSTTSQRYYDGATVLRNLLGTTGNGFLAIEEISQHVHVAGLDWEDNEVDGYGYGTYGGHRGLLTRVNRNLSTSVATGQDPRIQNITFKNNRVTSGASFNGPIFTAKYVDGLVVTGNDANLASGTFLSTTSCTSVTNSGNS